MKQISFKVVSLNAECFVSEIMIYIKEKPNVTKKYLRKCFLTNIFKNFLTLNVKDPFFGMNILINK